MLFLNAFGVHGDKSESEKSLDDSTSMFPSSSQSLITTFLNSNFVILRFIDGYFGVVFLLLSPVINYNYFYTSSIDYLLLDDFRLFCETKSLVEAIVTTSNPACSFSSSVQILRIFIRPTTS